MMRPKKYIVLKEDEIFYLEKMVKESPIHRVRQRSQALLWSHQGKDRASIAALYGIQLDTVSAWIKRWEASKQAGIADLPRSGRPSLLSEDEKKNSGTESSRGSQYGTCERKILGRNRQKSQ